MPKLTHEQFIAKYNGKFVEYHSFSAAAKNQCVDLANQYIVDVLGLKPIIGTNAYDFPSKKGDDFEYILNTITGVPKKGDLVIWSSADKVGHIAVFESGNASKFVSFDQNYPTGSPCKFVNHTYTRVVGWMRSKKPVLPEIKPEEKTYTVQEWEGLKHENQDNWDKWQAAEADLKEQKTILEETKKELNTFLETLAGKLSVVVDKAQIIGAVERLLEVEDQKNQLQKEKDQLEKKHTLEKDELTIEIKKLREEIERQQKQNETLLARVNELDTKMTEYKAQPPVITSARFFTWLQDIWQKQK